MDRLFVRVITLYCVLIGVLLPFTLASRHGQDAKWIKPGALDRWGQQQKLQGKPNDGSCEAQTEPLESDSPSDIIEDQRLASTHGQDAKWIKPGALDRWGQQQKLQGKPNDRSCEAQTEPLESDSPSDIIEDQRLALIFYRKLIKSLFARETLRADPTVPDYHNVDLSLQISSRQLDKLLDDSSSAREINLIVSIILEKSTNTQRNSIFREHQCERLYHLLMQFLESKVLHNLLPIILLLAICFTVRLISRLTRIHSFIVFLLLILSITVSSKWKECNEKLVVESLQHVEKYKPAASSYWGAMFGRFNVFGTKTQPDHSLAICDPLQVLVESTVQIQAVYFKSIFKELLNAFNESTEDAGIFQTIMIAMLLLGFTYVLITSLLNVGIRSGFELFGNMVTVGMQSSRNTLASDGSANNAQQQQQQPQQLPTVNLNFHIGDGIAKIVPLNEILQQENQRIEVVPEEVTAAIERAPSVMETQAAESLTTAENVETLVAKNQKQD